MNWNFTFPLLITPFKTLDNKHWKERYYQDYFTVDSMLAIKKGATLVNIHQGNKYNPFINYPFLTLDKLKTAQNMAKNHDMRLKVYYTVRELSVYTSEFWALRQLNDEIFSPSGPIKISKGNNQDGTSYLSVNGHPWLNDHLRTNYVRRWHTPLKEGPVDWDFAISTQHLSRWHNYYIEGLHWLCENVGIKRIVSRWDWL